MVKLQYSEPSRNDLKSIYNFIAFDSSYYAKKFIREIKERIKILKIHPEQGRVIHPFRYKSIRQVVFKSYRVIYIFENETVSIISIHHQSRLLENIDTLKQFEI